MTKVISRLGRVFVGSGILLLVGGGATLQVHANPAGGSVTGGSANATISGEGTSVVTINQSAQGAFINWQSFDIGVGETVNFNQPSSTSVTWNQINDSNPSQILGTLNANGYLILQNPNGFYISGQAAINAHGLVMTTASTPALNFSSGGPWSFNTPPPTKSIVNYGRINITGGGSAFLIADDVENNGTISAPDGKIGLYAGQTVLVSTSPDGRALSAQATVTQGLVDKVDNNGNLVADAGNITLQAQTVNQNGVIQADSAQNVNGTIELVAGDTVSLGANSTTAAEGSSRATSSGGVTVQAGNTINNNGQAVADGSSILMNAPTVNQNGTLQANSVGAANGFVEIDASDGLNLGADSEISADNLNLGVHSVTSANGDINFQALDNIEISSLLTLADSSQPATLSLAAGGTITLDNNSGIQVGNNWNINLAADRLNLESGASISSADNLNLGVHSVTSANGDINFQALDNIEISSLLTLVDSSQPATLSLVAGGTITLDNNSGIQVGNNWNINLAADRLNLESGASISSADNLNLGVHSVTSANGDINFQALNNIEISSLLTLADSGLPTTLSLAAGNNITVDNNSGISAGNNWNVNLAAGTSYLGTTQPNPGLDGIYLNDGSTIQTGNGNISLAAANEVVIGGGTVQTVNKGGIDVTAKYTVNNNGTLSAAGSSILMEAPTVNQNGILQADSLGNANGAVEIDASKSLTLGAASQINANGDSTAPSASSGGFVVLHAGNSFGDAPGSAISVSGQVGGQNGIIEIFGNGVTAGSLNSSFGNPYALFFNPNNLTLSTAATSTSASNPNLNVNDLLNYSQVFLYNIELASPWNLGDANVPATLNWSAMNNIILDDGSGIAAGNNWNVNLTAGTSYLGTTKPNSGSDGVYLNGSSTIQTQNGTISLNAANEVVVGSGGLKTVNGGGIDVMAKYAVDNNGSLVANGSTILIKSSTVNQNGILQANSVGTANGVIELDASDSLNLGAASRINASGDPAATSPNSSPGGFVVLNAGNNTFADTKGSTISVSGTAGGQNGIIEIFGNGITASTLQSTIGSYLAYLINPGNLYLSSGSTVQNTQPADTDPNRNDPQPWANLKLSDLSAYSQIDLQALNNITLNSTWSLGEQTVPDTPTTLSTLSLSAGNNVILNSSLDAGYNWDVNLTAGTAYSGPIKSGSDGIYVNGVLQTLNGDITLDAANEVIVGNAVRTVAGGNIDVTAQYGSVNTGIGANGFGQYLPAAPYYLVSGNLSGISTAAGGNVTINAGGDVISFPTTTVASGDPGTGAFGSEPGNVTINAGGSVYGNYVVMNGTGIINAGQNIGTSVNNRNVALSLAKGSWTLDAWGNIYLQEVRNPNGTFNDTKNYHTHPYSPSAGSYLFDYAPNASATLTAGNGVYLTGYDLPRPDGASGAVPLLLPPIVNINAGAGGVTLQTPSAVDNAGNSVNLLNTAITLFPSADGNLEITTTDGGGLIGIGLGVALLMSDSGRTQWYNTANGSASIQPFGRGDDAVVPAELNNPDPVVLNISGDMQNLTLIVSKLAQINVGGDMIGCTFYGENLQPDQTTSINVGGQIYNPISFASVSLDQAFPTLPAELLPPNAANSLFQILKLAVNPTVIDTLPGTTSASEIYNQASEFPGLSTSGISYNPNTKTLTFLPTASGSAVSAMEQPTLTFVVYQNGVPKVDPSTGRFVTETIPWMPANSGDITEINNLFTKSQSLPNLGSDGGYIVGGTGTFDVTANSISLGTSYGILSVGSEGSVNTYFGKNYSFLAPYITSGATINVTVLGQEQTVNGQTEPSLLMPASTIAALAGGDVNITCAGEMPNPNGPGGISMDLGSQDLVDFYGQIMTQSGIALGIYTTGGGNVNVTAQGDINVDTSRIATFNGGDISVESYTGNVNAGSGGSTFIVPIVVFSPDVPDYGQQVYANGIVAETLTDPSQVPGGATEPGNITVWTPEGDINANVGGIKQEALNGTAAEGPTITLTAGTPAPGQGFNSSVTPLYVGNIDLGTVGAIGETIIAQATGTIKGLAVSQHNTSITSQSVGSLTVLAGGTANVSAQSSGSGAGITIIGGQGVNASGIGAGATLLGQNVSVNGGAATSTLGTSATATAASQSAAGQSSSEAQQQVASNSGEEKKKKKKKKAELVRSVGRVTVILPKDS